jgi:Ca2+-binding RTX toxin-like protein
MGCRRALTTIVLVLVASCEASLDEVSDLETFEARFGADPCKTAVSTVKRGGDGRFVGTNGRDVIVGTDGPDVIFGLGGDDLICGLGGDDYIDGGDGRDLIYAGGGNDTVHGRGGSDRIYGGDGDDVLFGDILDDKLYGDAGDDVLIGGHGTDRLDGGGGADFMRGDTGNDTFIGAEGYDIASFATALPPGQTEFKPDGTPSPITGMLIDLGETCKDATDGGCANGDGGNESLHGIDEVIGSAFTDRIRGAGRKVVGGFGADEIENATGPAPGPSTPTSTVYIDAAVLQGKLVDVGVVVLGSPGADNYQIVADGLAINVIATKPIAAGEGCVAQPGNRVHCDVGAYIAARPHREAPFHYVVAWGDNGDDTIELRGEFPREFETHISGGEGNDHLIGGKAQDVLFTGTDGTDWLEGREGDDALLSESHHTDAWKDGDRPESRFYKDGADLLDAGPDNDQLVADYVCGGHRYIGGSGHDIAGFARSGKFPIHAQLGGPVAAANKTQWWGKAANMELCGGNREMWTTMKTGEGADLEVLEASDGADVLFGDDRPNVIWGRAGGDKIKSFGGRDEVLGADGNDTIDGGGDVNYIEYGRDN